jgi:PleD family two-component response regulator
MANGDTLIYNSKNAVLFKNEKVTISIGLVEALTTDDAYQIAKRADVLLYQAKNTGKNHVEYDIKD